MSTNFQNFHFSVFIRSGRDFENKKWLESNSPFVEVTIGDETLRTSKLSDLKNPCWNQTLKFKLKDYNNLPTFIKFVVKDDRMLFASVELGDYMFNLEQDKLLNYQTKQEMTPFLNLYDGLINLNNCERGTLDVQILFVCGDCNWLSNDQEKLSGNLASLNLNNNNEQILSNNEAHLNISNSDQQVKFEQVKKDEFEKIPDIVYQKNEVEDNKKDEELYKRLDQNEVHTLPTIHVQDKPKIIEKEVEYIKPVEVKETIIHKEKPIIIEQPIIKEKHEHYREMPKYEKTNQTIINESIHEEDVGNLDEQQLKNLREQRKQEFNDTTPIIEKEKKFVQLETDFREKPAEIREKEVIYQQPIEIEKTNIEKIKPIVREDVTLEKEHVYQKVAPEIQSENVQVVRDKDQFYSKETDNNLKVISTDNNQQSLSSNN